MKDKRTKAETVMPLYCKSFPTQKHLFTERIKPNYTRRPLTFELA
jgi:hypothetical protein